MILAVYGTLKKGGPLHHKLQEIDAEFMNNVILKGYEMYNLGWFPAIIKNPETYISVETYKIDAKDLHIIDRVEGYPQLYQRENTTAGVIYYMEDKERVKNKEKTPQGYWEN